MSTFFYDYYFSDKNVKMPWIVYHYKNFDFGDQSTSLYNDHYDKWYKRNFYYVPYAGDEGVTLRARNSTGNMYRRYHNASEWDYHVKRAFYNSAYNGYYNRDLDGRGAYNVQNFKGREKNLRYVNMDYRDNGVVAASGKFRPIINKYFNRPEFMNSKDYDFMQFYRNIVKRDMLTPEDYFYTEYLPEIDYPQIFARGDKMVLTDLTPYQIERLREIYNYALSWNEVTGKPKNHGIAGYLEVQDLTPKEKDVPVFKGIRPIDRNTGKSYISPMNSRHTLKLFRKHPEIREKLQKIFDGGR